MGHASIRLVTRFQRKSYIVFARKRERERERERVEQNVLRVKYT